MHYADIKMFDIANGPGVRVSLFVSGCRRGCKGCFNKEAQSFDYGKKYTYMTYRDLMFKLNNPYITGLSILGGDPCEPENQKSILKLCRNAKLAYPEKDIWMWTGFIWEEVKDLPVMQYIDMLVDGPFIESHKNLSMPYCGSSNQRVVDVKKSLESGLAVLH